MTSWPSRWIQIDEEGYPLSDGLRIQDEELGRDVLTKLHCDERHRATTEVDGVPVAVESFDEPLVLRSLERKDDHWIGLAPYHTEVQFSLSSLNVDEWDRFHGETIGGVSFVFSRPAQTQFFNLVDDYDDDSFTVMGKKYFTAPWLIPYTDAFSENFWNQIYLNEDPPGFELGGPSPILPIVVPQLKMPRQRVLVPGCGQGHDAAYFAKQGHLVTAVDFSGEAITRAKKVYGDVSGLQFVQKDVFSLPTDWSGRFDLIFEHTCYCAVQPSRRNEMLSLWRRLLSPRGHLLGVFFAVPKRRGPPWGGSEWEMRERFRRDFDFQYWTRWRQSVPKRQGMELVLFAQKKLKD